MRFQRAGILVGLLSCPLVAFGSSTATSTPTNVHGAPTISPDGAKKNYTRSELSSQAAAPVRPSSAAPAAGPPVGIPASWTFAAFGSGIGLSGFVVAQANGGPEIYCGGSSLTFGGDEYWYALRYASATGQYDQIFVSERMPSPIVRILSGDLSGDVGYEIVVVLESGEVRLYDEDTKRSLPGFSTAAGVAGATLADLNGDARAELLAVTAAGLFVSDGSGAPLWNLPGAGGVDVTVGQMDDDAALEIATTSGDVVDSVTQESQWHWPAAFGRRVRAADIDGDGRDELIAAEEWYFVWSYDVERELPKWSIPIDLDIGSIALHDVDCDGRPDLLVGQGQWGYLQIFDTVTQQEKGSYPNPEHGVTDIALGDVDGDGQVELIWGAGATSTGPDYMYVVDLQSHDVEWSNADLVGPFVGTATGDIDGDGKPEIVAIATYSDAGYSGGRILVFDAATRGLRAVSDPVGFGFYPIEDLKLRNVDADPALEIVVAMNYLYDGVVRVYDFDAGLNAFTLVWENPEHPFGSPFTSVEIADADGDGGLDVVAGGSRAHTGADGVFIHLYDYATQELKWRSFQLGSYWSAIRDVVVETAGGGHPDILAIDEGSLYGFDGVTKESLQITPGSFSALRPDPFAAGRSVILGDMDGNLSRYDRGATKYVPGDAWSLGLEPIDGVTLTGTDAGLVGAGGRLRMFSTFDQPPAWESVDFGVPAGRLASRGSGAHARFFAGALFGIVEVAPETPLTSIAPSSGPAAGGTSVEATGSGFQPGALVFFEDDAAAPTIPGDDAHITGVAPPLFPGRLYDVTVLNTDTSFAALPAAFFADFLDVDGGHLFHGPVETILRARVTAGCGGGQYCPAQPVTRAQMAAFLVRAGLGGNVVPPPANGLSFTDVPCSAFAGAEIELIAHLGVTAGCGGGLYCPAQAVTRAQMAAFLLKMREGAGYVPPPATGVFGDVPVDDPFAPWIEELAARGITAGCGGGLYCPSQSVTRGQMAAFLANTFFVP